MCLNSIRIVFFGALGGKLSFSVAHHYVLFCVGSELEGLLVVEGLVVVVEGWSVFVVGAGDSAGAGCVVVVGSSCFGVGSLGGGSPPVAGDAVDVFCDGGADR